jgi:hypothetical protein
MLVRLFVMLALLLVLQQDQWSLQYNMRVPASRQG